jgi:hypothetical protein
MDIGRGFKRGSGTRHFRQLCWYHGASPTGRLGKGELDSCEDVRLETFLDN